MKKAIIYGASGFVGSYLLQELIDNPKYERVTAIMRKKPLSEHPKLKILLGDLTSLPCLKDDIEGNDVFIAIGTTKKKTPDLGEYYKADHDYPVLAASIAKQNGATAVFLVSAIGADVNSSLFYCRVKGEAEHDILALGFEHTHIFRPSVILGNRPEKRPLEKILIMAFTIFNPLLLGRLKRYRGIKACDIARAMNNAADHPAEKVMIYEWKAMQALRSSAAMPLQ